MVHSSRTAVAAVASVLVARLFRLPETYWAPITTLVITQSSLGTALAVSGERFMGTVFGAAVGAIVASHFGPHNARVRPQPVHFRTSLCRDALGSQRISFRWRYAGNCAARPAD